MSGRKLPEGWVNTEIGDIAEIISGGTPKSGNASNFAPTGEGIAWLTPADLSGYKKKCIGRGARDLSIDGYSSCSAKLMPAGAILFSSRAPIGYVAVASNEIATNQGFKSFVFTDEIYPDYAYYYLRNIRHLAEEKGTGTTFKEISGSSAKTLPFVISPFDEQKIIAEKLDTLLAQVDSTKARLEQIPKILKRFRQAVLVSAISGKLQAETTNKKKCTIDSLCLISFDGPFGSKLKTSDYTDSGVRVVRLENIGHLEFKSDKETYISHEKYQNLHSNTLKENDLLFSSFVDEDVRVCLIPKSKEIFINKADCFCLRVDSKLVSPHYLAFVLASKKSYQQVKDKVQGITRPRINLRTLRSLKFDIPTLDEQHEIVRRVEQLFSCADTIEKQFNNALARVNNLTQSILAKAFRGELTAQWRAENPELIRGENSAAALLEKIKAERAASTGKKASRKKS